MRDMSAEGIIASLQGDAEAKTERERRITATRLSLDQVATSILEAKAYLNTSLVDESEARTQLEDKEKETADPRARLAALETR